MSPTTPARNVERTCALIISTAFSPATMSTPASAYVSGLSSLGSVTHVDGTRHVNRARFLLEHVLRVVVGDRRRVLAAETGRAERVGGRTRRFDQAVEVEVRERVDTEVVGDLADRHVGGEQVGALAGVEAVEARPAVRRRAHAEVHFRRAGLAEQRDDLASGGAAHDRVFDDNQALALDVVAQRVELDAHTRAALFLARLDERAADVTVLHEAVAIGDARRTREALRGRD